MAVDLLVPHMSLFGMPDTTPVDKWIQPPHLTIIFLLEDGKYQPQISSRNKLEEMLPLRTFAIISIGISKSTQFGALHGDDL